MERVKQLQSRTKLLEKVFPIMSTFLRNKTISKTMPLREENPFPRFNVASHKRPGIRLSFEYTTTLLSGEGGEGRTGTYDFQKNAVQVYTFLNSFVQDCRTIMTRGKDRFMFSNNWIQSWLKTGTLERGFTSIQKVNSCLFQSDRAHEFMFVRKRKT